MQDRLRKLHELGLTLLLNLVVIIEEDHEYFHYKFRKMKY